MEFAMLPSVWSLVGLGLVATTFLLSADFAGGHHIVPTFLHRRDGEGRLIHVESAQFKEQKGIPFAQRPSMLSTSLGLLNTSNSSIFDGDDVTISWRNVTDPDITDWIALYCPMDTTDDDYLDVIPVNSSETWKTGAGNITIKLFNMRQTYELRYYQIRNGKHVEATNRIQITADGDEACHTRFIFTGEPNGIIYTWEAACGGEFEFIYSTDSELLRDVQEVNRTQFQTRIYHASDMCGKPANITSAIYFRDTGCIYSAIMDNLKPGTKYHYRVGVRRPGARRTRGHFTSPRALSHNRTRFIAYGDMGVQFEPHYWKRPGASMIVDALTQDVLAQRGDAVYDAICHIGDLSYAVGHGYLWEQWGWLMTKVASYVPYIVGVGNHEYDHINPAPGKGERTVDVSNTTGSGYHPEWGNLADDSHGECGVPTFNRFFYMPRGEVPGNSVFWYSFDRPLVRFIMLSTEHDLSNTSLQYAWLEKVLKSTNRSASPWVIVMGHRPAYSEETLKDGDNKVAENLRNELDDLFLKYRVNLMLTGHVHSYQRSCPGYRGGCRPDGTATVHLVIGTAGATLDANPNFPADFTMKGFANFGYCRVDCNTTHIHVDWVTVDKSKPTPGVADSVDIPLWKN